MVSGLPGTGKSYFASRLSQRLGAVYINSDAVRRELGAMGKYTDKDKLTVYEELFYRTKNSLNAGKCVVADATFHKKINRKYFFDWTSKQGISLVVFEVFASEEIIKKRLSKPRTYSEADWNVYLKLKQEREPLEIKHHKLESSSNNINFMLEKAHQVIESNHEYKAN
ncbi:AAA family ATPase [Litoribacter populi]|uniref:AAA family ATPase n=1 Tax=Litoribacter populi TaxID=2598460 RepID=UPI00163D4341|nr:AAA family ATPase [Litoribacter populi]